jgi:glyoxylase-like metal-dependent hydrolase (beta-lactamase superfamily II)
MTNAIWVGEIELTPLVDGEWSTGPEYFGPTASFAGHEDMLGEDGLLHLPIGCFLARGGPLGDRTVLVDAGLGDQFTNAVGPYTGGKLNDELVAAGVTRDDVDTVICSHLHLDHCGWLVMSDGTPGFPNARLLVGAPDWQSFVEEETGFMVEHVREGLRAIGGSGRVTLVDGDAVLEPGITMLGAPGHTPGHGVLVVADATERAILLGDAMNCPAQLEETDWGAMSDVDPELARVTRARFWDELQSEGTRGVGAHFPGLRFGRVLTGEGRRWWA